MKTRLLISLLFLISQAFAPSTGVVAQWNESLMIDPGLRHPPSPQPAATTIINATSTVTLGQPGLSFRYMQTFGVTEEAYLADAAHLNRPNGLFIDAGNNVYVVEELGSRMLKFDSTGANSLTIGMAGQHFVSDYVFSFPKDVITDSLGNIWVSDNHRLTQYDSGGTFIQVFPDYSLGPGNTGSDNQHFNNPRGLAFDSAGRLYVSDQYNHRVQVYEVISNTLTYSTTIGETGVSGSNNSHFNEPVSIVMDSADNLYVSDLQNFRIQKCSFSGTWTCTTFHGTGSAGGGANELNLAYGLGRDAADNIYIGDSVNGRVKQCTSGGVCADFATGILWPAEVAVDSSGNVYVSDFADFTIRKYNGAGVAQPDFAGTSGVPYVTDTVRLHAPWGIAAAPDGSLYVAENRGHRVVKLDAQGAQQWQIGQAGVYGSDNAHFGEFWVGVEGNLAVDSAGRIYVPDTGNHRIQVFNPDGGFYQSFGSYGTGNAQFDCPAGIAISPVNGDIVVVDKCNQRIQVFTGNWAYKATLGETDVTGADNSHFDNPWGVAVDASGAIYVADVNNRRVQKCVVSGSSGTCTTFAGETGVFASDFGHLHPLAVAVDGVGRVYAVDEWNNRVLVYDSTGAFLTSLAGQWGTRSGELRGPSGVAVDEAGNVYVTDRENHRIQKFALGVPGWRQSNLNGFGERYIEHLPSLASFGGYLYAGTANYGEDIFRVWRTADSQTWEIASPDLSDGVSALAVFSDTLYASTWNGTIWRSPDGLTWTNVITSGFGSSGKGIAHLSAYSDTLYAGTYCGDGVTGGEIWRTTDGMGWNQFVSNGFGDPTNCGVISSASFNGQVYFGVANWEGVAGNEIWRSDGITVTAVVTDGFGNPNNLAPGGLTAFNGALYASVSNPNSGIEVWRSNTGNPGSWTQVVSDGLGNSLTNDRTGLRVYNNQLYLVAQNSTTGLEVWRTADGTNWEQIGLEGFGDSNNVSAEWSGSTTVFNENLVIGVSNYTNGGEIWQYVGFPLYLPLIQR